MINSLISIIIPVYNAEKTVHKCVDTVSRQTYSNIEIILIDDGSVDSSYAICQQLCMEDKRLKLFQQKNSGPSSARNLGLEQATGEFVTFVDSDDWVEADWIEHYISSIRKNIDLYVCNFINEYPADAKKHEKYAQITTVGDAFIDIANKQSLPFLWCKLFRRSIIMKYGLRFDENLRIGEDNVFIIRYFVYTKGVLLSNHYCYHYLRSQTDSLSSKVYAPEYYFYIANIIQEYRQSFLEKTKNLFVDQILQMIIWSYMQFAVQMLYVNKNKIENLRNVCRIIEQYNISLHGKNLLSNYLKYYIIISVLPLPLKLLLLSFIVNLLKK